MTKENYDVEITATKSNIREVNDQELLANVGYKQELKRSFSLLSMVGFSFSILSCWCALAGSLAEVMLNGGPAVLVYGWIGCCALSMFVVLILAELCSAYPVAGGQYSWCLLLAKNTRWGRLASYACGWIQLSGILGMVAVGFYQFSLEVSAVAMLNNVSFVAENWMIALIGYGCALIAFVTALFGQRILHYISTASLWWSIGGFIICTVVTLACAPKLKPASFPFTEVISSGWGNVGMSTVLGIMQPAYGMCTYDSVAHLSEETAHASKQSPRAMVIAVIIGFLTGIGFILAILFGIQDLDAVVNTPTGFPLLEIFYQATSSKAAASCLVVIVAVCQAFTNVSLITTASRSVYAFARDGAFPFHVNKWLMKVSPRLNVPVWGMLASEVVGFALVAILFGSSTAFFTVLSIASTGLYISYLMPIVVYMIRRKHKAPGYYNLGRWAFWIMIPALAYLVFCNIFFFFPTEIPVDANNMNYNIVAFAIVITLATISWFSGARKSYIYDIGVIDGKEISGNVMNALKSDEDAKKSTQEYDSDS